MMLKSDHGIGLREKADRLSSKYRYREAVWTCIAGWPGTDVMIF
jgi:hypothetical protein